MSDHKYRQKYSTIFLSIFVPALYPLPLSPMVALGDESRGSANPAMVNPK